MSRESFPDWLTVIRNDAPLIVSLPHTGTEIPAEIMEMLVSPWLARKDTDWWIDRLYDFAEDIGATVIRTAISRTLIDVNRDPSGASLYPGRATTGLCPTTTFDGESLYRDGPPDEAEIARRRIAFFEPYHQALAAELDRLRELHGHVVLYDAHSIRSRIPRLFDGVLPHFNIGTNDGVSCARALEAEVERVCSATMFDRVTNGRFKGGTSRGITDGRATACTASRWSWLVAATWTNRRARWMPTTGRHLMTTFGPGRSRVHCIKCWKPAYASPALDPRNGHDTRR
jgi:formiminoglutamase